MLFYRELHSPELGDIILMQCVNCPAASTFNPQYGKILLKRPATRSDLQAFGHPNGFYRRSLMGHPTKVKFIPPERLELSFY